MDGIGGTPAKNEKAKNAKKTKANKKPEKSDTKMLSNDFDVDLDLEDDDDEMVDAGIDSGSEGEDDDDDDSEEEEEEEEEFISGKSKWVCFNPFLSEILSSLFLFLNSYCSPNNNHNVSLFVWFIIIGN